MVLQYIYVGGSLLVLIARSFLMPANDRALFPSPVMDRDRKRPRLGLPLLDDDDGLYFDQL